MKAFVQSPRSNGGICASRWVTGQGASISGQTDRDRELEELRAHVDAMARGEALPGSRRRSVNAVMIRLLNDEVLARQHGLFVHFRIV